MKRKLTALLTALLLMATLVTPAFADLIWEPMGNSFFDAHRNECEYVDRAYLVNGAQGYAAMKHAPDGRSEIMNVPNGTTVIVSFVWTDKDGAQWGIGYPSGRWEEEGWINLADMALIYDYICFDEDHSHEYQEYDGSGDHLTEALVYTYPGGVYSSKMEQGGGDYGFAEGFRNLYTDENGLRWTFIGYYMGHRDGWVCIDDPLNENLGVETAPTADQVRGAGSGLVPPAAEVPATGGFPLWIIPAVLVIAVAVATALIVRKRRKAA